MGRPLRSSSQQCRSDLLKRNSSGRSKQDLQKTEQLYSDSWSHQLCEEIIELILERLGVLDRIRFGAVCTSWRAAVAKSMATSVLDFPLVLYDVHPPFKDDRLLYSLVGDRYYSLNPVCTKDCRIINVIEGRWLVMENCGDPPPSSCPFILNPLTGQQFKLPPASTISGTHGGDPYSFSMIVASSQPTDSKCIVAGLGASGFSLVFCRLRDSKWTRLTANSDEVRRYQFKDIIVFDRKLYASTSDVDKFVIVFDLRHGKKKKNGVYKTKTILVGAPLPMFYALRGFMVEGGTRIYSFNATYMKLAADSVSGELLCIVYDLRFWSKKTPQIYRCSEVEEGVEKLQVLSISVYKMDGTVDEKNSRWRKVEDMGDRLLFSGKYSNFFIPTKEFGESIQGNAMYYTLQFGSGWKVGKYCFNKQTIVQCTPGALPSKITCATSPVGWFIPTIV